MTALSFCSVYFMHPSLLLYCFRRPLKCCKTQRPQKKGFEKRGSSTEATEGLNYFLRNSMQNDLKLAFKEPGCVFLQVLIYCWLHSKDYKKIGSFRDQNADFAALIANGSGIPHTRSVARSFSSTCSAEASDSSVA